MMNIKKNEVTTVDNLSRPLSPKTKEWKFFTYEGVK